MNHDKDYANKGNKYIHGRSLECASHAIFDHAPFIY